MAKSADEQVAEVLLALDGLRITHDEPSHYWKRGQWFIQIDGWGNDARVAWAWDQTRALAIARAHRRWTDPTHPCSLDPDDV